MTLNNSSLGATPLIDFRMSVKDRADLLPTVTSLAPITPSHGSGVSFAGGASGSAPGLPPRGAAV